MKRPSTVRVAHLRVQIKWVREADWDKEEDSKIGLFKPNEATILVRLMDGISEDNLREILTHELLHAVYYVSNLCHYPQPKKGEDLEEYTVSLMAGPLLDILRDNKALMEYLLS